MLITIDPSDLREAVRFASTATGPRILPILGGILIECADNRATFSATDYDRVARVAMDANVTAPGEVVLEGRMLLQVAGKFKARGLVTIHLDGNMATLSQGRNKIQMPAMPIDDYPRKVTGNLQPIGMVNGESFAKLIHNVAVAASKDLTLPILSTVRLDLSNELQALATDRYRLAYDVAEWEPASEIQAGVTLKVEWALTVAKTVSGETTLLADDPAAPSRFGVRSGSYEASTILVNGDYPKIRVLFNNRGTEEHVFDRAELIEAADMANVVTERGIPILLEGEGGEVTVSGGDQNHSSAYCTSDNESSFRFAVNPALLLDLLRTLDTQTVRITLHENTNKPFHIGAKDASAEYLLMPVRLPGN